jgi:hypothetical protein
MADDPIYIVTADLVKKLGNFSNVSAEKIEVHFPQAKRDTKAIIGTENYATYLAKEDGDTDKDLVARGEANFVLSYLVRALNNVSGGSGLTRATGFNDGRSENISGYDTERLITYYRSEAERILNNYKVSTDTDDDDDDDICNAGAIRLVDI